jgi:His/Glu/Gln/Arg/opine family amino acid ABC transporter permease subunit
MLPDVLIENFGYLLRGAVMTVALATATVVPSAVIGMVLALAKVFGGIAVRAAAEVYLYVIRGVPLLVLLFFMYYALPYSGIDLPPLFGGVLVMSLYFGAFMAEIFRAAILSLPRAQWDAARSLGMPRPLMFRIIIYPQVFRLAAPPFVNTCILLVKSTSLVSIINLWELTLAGREVVERTFAPLQIFGGVALIYFVLCYALSRYGLYLEERMRFAH